MSEKEHAASEGQRQKFADRGELPRSQDLTRFAVMAGGVGFLVMLAQFSIGHLLAFASRCFGSGHTPLSADILKGFGGAYISTAAPSMLGAMIVGLAVGLGQTRGSIGENALAFKFEKLNPLPGIKRIFMSMETVVGLLMSSGKVMILAIVCAWTLYSKTPLLLASGFSSLGGVLRVGGDMLLTLLVRALLTMLILAVADFAVNWLKLERKMKMSTQDLKDENKEQNGDPQIRAQRRRKHRELAEQRSLTNVPDADVVVVNPTHYAVALSYNTSKDPAPRVVAKGVDKTAERIRDIARKSGVPVVTQPPLTRLLYKSVKVGKVIPVDLFQAVASVLAFVYRRRNGAA